MTLFTHFLSRNQLLGQLTGLCLLLMGLVPHRAAGQVPTIDGPAVPDHGLPGTMVTVTVRNSVGAPTIRLYDFRGQPVAPAASATLLMGSTNDWTVSFTIPATTPTGLAAIEGVDPARNIATSISCTLNGGTPITSCYAAFVVTAAPVVSSFTPTSGPAGTTVTIKGANFLLLPVQAVRFNGVAATTYAVVSDTVITARVPVGASTGKISVQTADGTGQSAASFTVTGNVPAIFSFAPASGAPGTSVTVSGTNFTGASAVRFNGVAATFAVVNNTTLTATVPAGATTGKISVVAPGGTALSAVNFTVTLAVPVVSSFTPTSGPPGNSVTITGSQFVGISSVRFNGQPAAFTVNSATSITATVPAGATTGPISVRNSGGTGTSAANFTIAYFTPTISGFTPTAGGIGTQVVISGTNFNDASQVTFNGVVANTYTVNSPTQITASVPTGATTGKIGVVAPGGSALSAANFTLLPAPLISAFSPPGGPVGTVVTISGANFTGATSVRIGAVSMPFTVLSATQIQATVPAGAATGKLTVTTPGGSRTTASSFIVPVPGGPVISGFSPGQGAVGASVTVTGTNFTGATQVTFNNRAASFTVVNATTITATVPALATTGRIVVTTPVGSGLSATNFTVLQPPVITGFSPASGPVGTVVTITGTNFTAVTNVRIGALSMAFTVVTGARIDATVPAGAVTAPLTVTTPAGSRTSAASFMVTPLRPGMARSGVETEQVAEQGMELVMWPNPAHEVVYLTGANRGPVQLLDALGRLVRTVEATAGGTTTLDVRGLPAGLYTVRAAGQRRQVVINN